MKFSYITLRPIQHKQDKNKQEKFKKYFNKIVNSHPEKEVFFDESGFRTHSKIEHGWFQKGVRTQVKMKIG